MSPAITVLRTNSAVVAMRMLVLIATVVLPALGVYLSRLGMSLKPIVFMAGFFDIIVGPQLAFHLGQALGAIPRRDLTGTFGSSRPHAAGRSRRTHWAPTAVGSSTPWRYSVRTRTAIS